MGSNQTTRKPRHNTIEAFQAEAMLLDMTYYDEDHVFLTFENDTVLCADTMQFLGRVDDYISSGAIEARLAMVKEGMIGLGTGDRIRPVRSRLKHAVMKFMGKQYGHV